ncbi:MAG: hypothetical protein ACPLW7_03730 [Minisyncoccia bacterium]|jgi:hypothetical protein
MTFFPLKNILSEWLKKKNFDRFLTETQVVSVVKFYLKNIKKISSNDIEDISYRNGILVIKCNRVILASELYFTQEELKNFLAKELPEIKIKRIIFRS